MIEYVRHKMTLRRKMLSKRKLKELKLSNISDVIDDPAPDEAVCSGAPLSVELLLTVDSPSVSYPSVVSCMDEKLSTVQANIFSQFSSVFVDFSKQLENKFSKIDDRFDKLGSSQISSVSPSQGPIDVSQDVSNVFSFSAVLTGHPLAKASYASRQGGLEIPLGRAAAEVAPMGGSSLPRVQLRDLEQALLSYDQLGVSLPEDFLASLCAVLVVSLDQGIAVNGSSVAIRLLPSVLAVCLWRVQVAHFCNVSQISISTLPSHIYSTILFVRQSYL